MYKANVLEVRKATRSICKTTVDVRPFQPPGSQQVFNGTTLAKLEQYHVRVGAIVRSNQRYARRYVGASQLCCDLGFVHKVKNGLCILCQLWVYALDSNLHFTQLSCVTLGPHYAGV